MTAFSKKKKKKKVGLTVFRIGLRTSSSCFSLTSMHLQVDFLNDKPLIPFFLLLAGARMVQVFGAEPILSRRQRFPFQLGRINCERKAYRAGAFYASLSFLLELCYPSENQASSRCGQSAEPIGVNGGLQHDCRGSARD
jgi:hypothetical protein